MIIDWRPCSTEIKCYILLRICCKCSVLTTSKFPIFKNDNMWYIDNVLLKSLGIRLNQPHITSLKLSLVSYILTPSLSLMLISAPLVTRYFNISRWFPSAAMYTGVHWWSEKQKYYNNTVIANMLMYRQKYTSLQMVCLNTFLETLDFIWILYMQLWSMQMIE